MAATNSTSTNSAPSWALPYWGSYLQGASNLSSQPYQRYSGPRVADFSPEQYQGMGMTANLASGGNPAMSALQDMYGGGGGAGMLSYGGTAGRDVGSPALRRNPLLDSASTDLDSIIQHTNADTTRDYATGTAAQTDARAARARAFGGSAYEETTRQNAASLADRLAGNESGLRYQDLQGRRQLEDAQLQRELQASISNNQLQAQMGSAATSAATSRMNSQDANRLAAAQFGVTHRYDDANALMNVGNLRQMYSQNLINSDYGDFTDQRDYPQTQLDRYGNAISRATGGQGTTTQQTNNSSNPWANLLGGSAMGLALWNMYNGTNTSKTGATT